MENSFRIVVMEGCVLRLRFRTDEIGDVNSMLSYAKYAIDKLAIDCKEAAVTTFSSQPLSYILQTYHGGAWVCQIYVMAVHGLN